MKMDAINAPSPTRHHHPLPTTTHTTTTHQHQTRSRTRTRAHTLAVHSMSRVISELRLTNKTNQINKKTNYITSYAFYKTQNVGNYDIKQKIRHQQKVYGMRKTKLERFAWRKQLFLPF